MNKSILLIVINVDWLFLLHRLSIAKEAKKRGFRVVVAAKDQGEAYLIEREGLEFLNLDITRSGTELFQEINSILCLYKIYKQVKPDVLYHITMKPVIYGSILARLLKIKNVNGISGLGYNFSGGKTSIIQKLMIRMMRYGFSKKASHFIFENNDDLQELINSGIIKSKTNTSVVSGVGVNLEKYFPQPKEEFLDKLVVLLPTRMLWDKGVREFIEAAKQLKNRYYGKVVFRLCGMLDKDNKEAIEEGFLLKNRDIGYLEWDGHQKNTINMYRDADIVVLPSYREGKPTVLLEAAAMGKPLITTNAPGCKDCVDEGVNGFKVPVKDTDSLVKAIQKIVDSPLLRENMGVASREKALKEFDQNNVIEKHLSIYDELLNS